MAGAADIATLEPLIGTWQMVATFEGMPSTKDDAPCSFEWMPGRRFLIQRWSAPDPAPSGIAIIGPDPEREGGFLQHYFDSRGVARVYKLALQNGILKLWRDEPDFSPLDFEQRYTGAFSSDGSIIRGEWEIRPPGSDWRQDFGLDYRRP